MYNKEELLEMTKEAKKKLESQTENKNVDYYAEFRDEFDEEEEEEVDEVVGYDENFTLKHSQDEEEYHNNIKYSMDDKELEYEEELMDQAKINNEEEILFPGGPTKSELDGWKKKYEMSTIYITEVMDRMFIFRTLNRFEYKQLIRQPNLDASQREEIICETVTLFPYNYNWREMAKGDAGIPSTLSQIIMTKSGFTDEYAIERL